MKLIFVLSALLFFSLGSYAQTPSFESHFQRGLKLYQTKVYADAQKEFEAALKLEPRNTAAMSNLGLAFSQQSQWGLAIAWFRRALTIDPSEPTARAGLAFATSQLEIKEIPHRIETFETLRTSVLQYFSLSQFLGISLVLLFSAGWGVLSWWGQRRRAIKLGDVPKSFPLLTGFALIMLIVSTAGAIFKVIDLSSPRGTIVAVKSDALSAPGADGVALFELHQGFEVLIGDVQSEWVQVTYPGGLTGWILQKDLIPLESVN